ncbi:PIH1 family [Cladochytrium replicatum]|nr:PIH1 family [Cladochytrium replicatum]
MDGPGDILGLASLLQQASTGASENSSNHLTNQESTAFSPGTIGPPPKKRENSKKQTESKEIWDEDEVLEDYYSDPLDERKQPEYTMRYRQEVSSSDIFLGISGKSPSVNAHSDHLVIDIDLPGVQSLAELTLECRDAALDVRTKTHKLTLALPKSVDHAKGDAKWDGNTQKLKVTLPISKDG